MLIKGIEGKRMELIRVYLGLRLSNAIRYPTVTERTFS